MKKTLFETLKKDLKSGKFSLRQIFAFVILLVIVIVFVFFGYSAKDSIGSGLVGQVNDHVISPAEFAREYDWVEKTYGPLIRQLGNAKTQEQFLRSQALDSLINKILMFQAAQEFGISAPKAELVKVITKDITVFQEDGRFKRDRYEGLLAANNWSVAEFEAQISRERVMKRFEWVLNSLVEPSSVELKYLRALSQQQRRVEYVTWDSNEWIEAQRPEISELRKALSDTEFKSRVQKEFEARKETLSQPEKVRARHILIRVGEQEKTEEALKKAQDIAKQVNRQNFASLAKKHSDDPGSKDKGGDLDYFARGTMVPAFEEYAFTAPVGQISQPIKSEFGYHIIEVMDKKPAKEARYEEHELEMAKRVWARDRYEDEVKKLEEAFKQGDFALVNQMLTKWNVKWQTSEWFSLADDSVPGVTFTLQPEKVWEVSAAKPYLSEVGRDGGRLYLVRFKEERVNKDAKKDKELAEQLKKEKFNEILGRYLDQFKSRSRIIKNEKT